MRSGRAVICADAYGLQCTEARAGSELTWPAELPVQSGQQVLRHLDAAFDNFFNSGHLARFPA
ncbi:hypothetical protein ABZV67_01940 [Streptomyces sp. NPDC005065]|uniref:hypothetical protein n=1 Tax=unclassified Streptomyces TaxID=2593676 RepID=UPI0033ABD63F